MTMQRSNYGIIKHFKDSVQIHFLFVSVQSFIFVSIIANLKIDYIDLLK